jgi:type IV secretory pathway VirB10-like protein
MNEHTSHPHSHLGRLLDEATAHYNPQPDAARFERMLLVQHRRRAGLIMWSAAACFALIGGTTFAFNQGNDDHRIAPAHSQVENDTESTAVKTTDHLPDKTSPYATQPDGGHDPIDKPPKTTEPPVTEPKTTTATTTNEQEPETTEPETTETTEPGDETTTTEVEGTWSVHQVYFTCDSEPPFEVFWGTANIGDKVKIESPYGSTKVFADANGDWEAHIYFEGAPVGVPFEIWVRAPYHDEAFTFTYLG